MDILIAGVLAGKELVISMTDGEGVLRPFPREKNLLFFLVCGRAQMPLQRSVRPLINLGWEYDAR